MMAEGESNSEFIVKRLRIGRWIPGCINTATFDPDSSRVAIGRKDGDIEILGDNQNKWFCQATIPGISSHEKSADIIEDRQSTDGDSSLQLQVLCWELNHDKGSGNSRLFGASLRGFIFEVDLKQLRIQGIQESYGGAVWSMACCPYDSLLAVSCEDGTVRIFRYGDDSGEKLTYLKSISISSSIASQKVAALSVAFHPNSELKRLFIGGSDGAIRCVQWSTGRVIFRMTGDIVTPRRKGKSAVAADPVSHFAPMMWCLQVLSGGAFLASGDSRGQLQIWDINLGVLVCTYKQHLGDVLAVAASADGRKVFSSGVDGKVCCVERIGVNTSPDQHGGEEEEWIHTYAHRAHTHDVHALTVCGEVLLSGGVDSKLCAYSVQNFARVRPRWIPSLPANRSNFYLHPTLFLHSDSGVLFIRLVQHTESYGVIAIQQRHSVEVWAMNDNPEMSLCLELKGDDHIHCMALSPTTASMLAVSTAAGTRVWQLSSSEEEGGGMQAKKMQLPIVTSKFSKKSLQHVFCHAMRFSSDESLLAAYCSHSSSLALFRTKLDQVTLQHVFESSDASEISGPAKEDLLSVPARKIVFSSDGQFLAMTDCSHGVYIYSVDRSKLHWRIPTLSHAVTDAEFIQDNLSDTLYLVVLAADNSLLVFDVLARNIAPRFLISGPEQDVTLPAAVPARVQAMLAPLCGIAVNAAEPHKLILYSHAYAVWVDLSRDPNEMKLVSAEESRTLTLATQSISLQKQMKFIERKIVDKEKSPRQNKKQKREEEERPANFIVFNVYRNLIHVGYPENNTMVVIENPWTVLMKQLPEMVDRKRYGMS